MGSQPKTGSPRDSSLYYWCITSILHKINQFCYFSISVSQIFLKPMVVIRLRNSLGSFFQLRSHKVTLTGNILLQLYFYYGTRLKIVTNVSGISSDSSYRFLKIIARYETLLGISLTSKWLKNYCQGFTIIIIKPRMLVTRPFRV